MIDWIESILDGEDRIYSFEDIQKRLEYRQLTEFGYLVINRKSSNWLQFAVLELYSSNHKGIFFTPVFYGEGPVGSLRECRHTYWGNEGYLYLADGVLISKAFKALSEFFDMMTSDTEKNDMQWIEPDIQGIGDRLRKLLREYGIKFRKM